MPGVLENGRWGTETNGPRSPGKSSLLPRLQVGNLSRAIEKINGVARCPYDPRHNSTAVISSQGELYAATVIDFSGRDPAIYRSLGSGPPLRTAQYNSKWLNGKVAQAWGGVNEGLSCLPKPIGLSSLSCFVNKVDRAGKMFAQRPRHVLSTQNRQRAGCEGRELKLHIVVVMEKKKLGEN